MKYRQHELPVTTDPVLSIALGSRTSQELWTLVKGAVKLGLFYPNVSVHNPYPFPEERGVFRLAYYLSPNFATLPRRGQAVKVEQALAASRAIDQVGTAEQVSLF